MESKQEMISQLRKNLLQWEGYKPPVTGARSLVGLVLLEAAFPNGVFPVAAGTGLRFKRAGSSGRRFGNGYLIGIITTRRYLCLDRAGTPFVRPGIDGFWRGAT